MTDIATSTYWRARADEARALAASAEFPAAREALLRIVEGYEYLAHQADRFAITEPGTLDIQVDPIPGGHVSGDHVSGDRGPVDLISGDRGPADWTLGDRGIASPAVRSQKA